MSRDPRIRGIRRLFRLPGTSDSVRREVDDEIRFHLETRTTALMAQGMGAADARAAAEREFGDARAAREELALVGRRRVHRERRAAWWDGTLRDLHYTVRGLWKQKAFATVVVLTLALGIGANATMFGLVDRLLLRPPAYIADAGRTGRVYLVQHRPDGSERIDNNINYLRFTELRDETRSFDEVAAYFEYDAVVGVGDAARQLRVGMGSANLWRIFDAPPVLGRVFGEDEDQPPRGAPVAVLGHEYWRTAFGASRDVLGTQVMIGGAIYTIIGVAPPGFNAMSLTTCAAFVPIAAGAADLVGPNHYRNYNTSWLEIIARRRAGVSIDAATADLSRVYRLSMARQIGGSASPEATAAALERVKPSAILGPVLSQRGPKSGPEAKVATWVLGVAVIVLLVACANATNLLLARALGRRREIAVRVALGVSRGRLVSQLLVESLVLALLAGAAGLMLAQWGGGIARAVLMPDVAWGNVLADRRILALGFTLAVVVGLVTGLAPALHALRPDVADALKAGGREGSTHRSRLRSVLLVAQAAMSVLLLVGAGLFVRSLHNVRSLDLGLDVRNIAWVRVDARGTPIPRAERSALLRRLEERARALPSVVSVARTATVPFRQSINEDLFAPGVDSVNRRGDFYLNAVSPEYFVTTGTRIVRGRGIEATDRAGAPPVAVVSRSAARAIWKSEDVIGKCLKVGADTSPCRDIVGVAQDMRWGTFGEGGSLQLFLSDEQYAGPLGLYVRTRDDARRSREAIRLELQRLAPGTSYIEAFALQDIIDPNMRPWMLGATMFSLFGLLALSMAGIGLYSAIAYGVSQRRHEIGVRLALGAAARDIVRMVMGEGMRVVLTGVAIGILLAIVASRKVATLLFGVGARDPVTIAVVSAALILVAIAASLYPAWRASRVDPVTALRSD
jgi:putative ABC transport system permease protein